MAELLVYNRAHWMDKLPETELQKRLQEKGFAKQYQNRWQPGHVVEIRPDGFWTQKCGFRKDVFSVIALPGVPEKDVQYLLEPHTQEVANMPKVETAVLHRRRYKLKLGTAGLICRTGEILGNASKTLVQSLTEDRAGELGGS